MDSGSQRSYVSESLAKRLDLKTEGIEEINVMTFGSDEAKNVKTKISSLQIQLRNGENIKSCTFHLSYIFVNVLIKITFTIRV